MNRSDLQRNYFETIYEFEDESFKEIDFKIFFNFLLRVEALFQKCIWECTPMFLQTLFILTSLTHKFTENGEERSFRLNFLKKVFKRSMITLKSEEHVQLFRKVKNYFELRASSIEDEE